MSETSSHPELRLAQVAFVGGPVGLAQTTAWYQDTLGFEHTGGLEVDGGPDEADFLDLSVDPKLKFEWLVDRNDAFQLELYEFTQPAPRPKPDTWTPRDIGYTLTTIWVDDFDGAVERGGAVAGPTGEPGSRRALLRDPNGNLLELLEADPLPDAAVWEAGPALAVRGVRASVPDLAAAVDLFVTGLGLEALTDPWVLHRPEHEELWGLPGEEPGLATFRAGDLFIELAEYTGPPGAPWPADHRVSDVGVLNIALATDSKDVWTEVADRVTDRGCRVRRADMTSDLSLAYVTDKSGLGIELLFVARPAYLDFGFRSASD